MTSLKRLPQVISCKMDFSLTLEEVHPMLQLEDCFDPTCHSAITRLTIPCLDDESASRRNLMATNTASGGGADQRGQQDYYDSENDDDDYDRNAGGLDSTPNVRKRNVSANVANNRCSKILDTRLPRARLPLIANVPVVERSKLLKRNKLSIKAWSIWIKSRGSTQHRTRQV